MLDDIFIGKRYKHKNGNIYLVTGIAMHTETEEFLIIYDSEYPTKYSFARPINMFMDGRFKLVENE